MLPCCPPSPCFHRQRCTAVNAAVAFIFIVVIVAVIVAVSVTVAAAAFSWLLFVVAPTIAVAASVFVATVAGGGSAAAATAAAELPAAAAATALLPSYHRRRRAAAATAAAVLPPHCRRCGRAVAKLLSLLQSCPPLPSCCRCRWRIHLSWYSEQAVVRLMKHSKIRSFFFHDENPTNLKGPIDSLVRSESIQRLLLVGFQETIS
jgi:hypothetical protein